jgi:hypothetical protein
VAITVVHTCFTFDIHFFNLLESMLQPKAFVRAAAATATAAAARGTRELRSTHILSFAMVMTALNMFLLSHNQIAHLSKSQSAHCATTMADKETWSLARYQSTNQDNVSAHSASVSHISSTRTTKTLGAPPIDTIKASASVSASTNAVMEGLALQAPFLIRKLDGPVEYLGADYPLFFESLDEVQYWLDHEDVLREKMVAAHEYLQRLDTSRFAVEYMGQQMVNCTREGPR